MGYPPNGRKSEMIEVKGKRNWVFSFPSLIANAIGHVLLELLYSPFYPLEASSALSQAFTEVVSAR